MLMSLKTFKGGVHPYEGKELSKMKPIKELKPQGDLVFPLSQHIGAPATACVNVGDTVLRGQKIAEAGGFVSAPIYSSVSGTVKAIEPSVPSVPPKTGDTTNLIFWLMSVVISAGAVLFTGRELFMKKRER